MRKTLAIVALTASLFGGTAVVATSAYAAQPVTQTTEDDGGNDGDKSGLIGLLGLAGLAGLLRRKEDNNHTDTTRR